MAWRTLTLSNGLVLVLTPTKFQLRSGIRLTTRFGSPCTDARSAPSRLSAKSASPARRRALRLDDCGMNFQVISSIFGAPRQYSLLAVSVMWSPATHRVSLKGPVATGARP
jgi:hypothetical protein